MSVNTFNRILNILRSRLARNIYFWGFAFFFVLGQVSPHRYDAKWYVLFTCVTSMLLMALTYVNNLVLVPRLLAKRKVWLYLLAVLIHISIITFLYLAVIKFVQRRFPVMDIQQISFISGPVSDGWAVDDILSDMSTYFIGFILWIFIFTMAWFMTDYGRQRRRALEAEKKRTEIELHFLKSQLNPHFLFNTLNNLYGLALRKADTAPESILKLSSILRYMLYESNVPLVAFEKEKEIIEAYISLELLRLSNHENLKFTIEADDKYMVPPLLWLPVLENAFKYGTRYISEDYKLNFSFTIHKDILIISSDNIYKNITVNKAYSGIGIDNLKKRLDILYFGKYGMDIHSTDDQYHIKIKIEL